MTELGVKVAIILDLNLDTGERMRTQPISLDARIPKYVLDGYLLNGIPRVNVPKDKMVLFAQNAYLDIH